MQPASLHISNVSTGSRSPSSYFIRYSPRRDAHMTNKQRGFTYGRVCQNVCTSKRLAQLPCNGAAFMSDLALLNVLHVSCECLSIHFAPDPCMSKGVHLPSKPDTLKGRMAHTYSHNIDKDLFGFWPPFPCQADLPTPPPSLLPRGRTFQEIWPKGV